MKTFSKSLLVSGLGLAVLLAPQAAMAGFWGTFFSGAAGGFVGGWLGSRHGTTYNSYYYGGNTYNITEVDYGKIAEVSKHAMQQEIDDDVMPRIEQLAQRAAAESYAGARKGAFDGVMEGLRVYFLQKEQEELAKKMRANERLFHNEEPKLAAKVEALGQGTGYVCSAFCGGLDENGVLKAEPVAIAAAEARAGFAALAARCDDDRALFRDVRNVKLRTGKVYQKLILSQPLTACDALHAAEADASVKTASSNGAFQSVAGSPAAKAGAQLPVR